MKKFIIIFFITTLGKLLLCTTNSIAQTNQYVDLSQSVLNSTNKPGWNLVFQDEFNGSKSSVWKSASCAGFIADQPFYFRASNYLQTSSSLKFTTKKDNPILPPLSPNYTVKTYSSAEIESDPCTLDTLPQVNHTWKYGYFEARINNPKAQLMWPAFWLFGEPNSKSKYNEIDCFEFGTGDELVMTNHFRSPTGSQGLKAKWLYSLPLQTFGNTWVTYAVKWEPNKIVWYINNIPVRVETDRYPSTSIIPSTAMRIIANAAFSEYGAPYTLNLPKLFPNYMEVDYIRVFQRANYNNPDPIFTINKQTSYIPQSPINVPFNSNLPIYLDGSQSYMPGHSYLLSIQRCDANGILFTPEAVAGLTSTEVDNIQQLDIKAFASAHGLTMSQGNYYRIKLAGTPWVETNQYIYVSTCANVVNFKINGSNTLSWPNAMSIAYNNGKPRIISDVSATITCDNNYFLSVAQCNASGSVIAGTEKTKSLTANDKKYIGYFDIEDFCTQNGLVLTDGNYYKIKWVAPSPWTEKAQVIYMTPCSNFISFDINGQTNAFPTPINIPNGSNIILDGSASRFCANTYFISVQECTSNGSSLGTEISEWNPHYNYDSQNQVYYYSIGRVDIQDFCRRKNFDLRCGKYYRIKLATGAWTELVKVIYIQPCSNINNSFEVYKFDYENPQSTDCYITNECFNTDAVNLYAPNSISCTQTYFLSVRQRINGVMSGPEAMKWLSLQEIYNLKTLGYFDLVTFAKDPTKNGPSSDDINWNLNTNATYNVKLVAGAGTCNSFTWVENNKTIFIGGGSGSKQIGSTVQSFEEPLDGMQVYPNPASTSFLINSSLEKNFVDLKIMDLLGKTLKTLKNIAQKDVVDVSEFPSGVYIVQGTFDDGSIVAKKLQVVK